MISLGKTALLSFLSLSFSLSSLSSLPRAVEALAPGPKDVTAVLFEWKFESIERECEKLGKLGYGFVQVSPPQEHIQGSEWWTSYQPVSYKIAGRLGDREAFKKMVDTCNRAGVKIIADAVINHMSAGGRGAPGTGGSPFTKYNYPGIYQDQDFHRCRSNIEGGDYTRNRQRVQECELESLADLDTSSEYVRQRIAQYFNDLLDLGVTGFRVDAVKHMAPQDLAGIKAKIKNPSVYWAQEVIFGAGEAIKAEEYLGTGEVQEFRYSTTLKAAFQRTDQKLANLKNFGESWGFLKSEQANVFVTNHDTERNGMTLSFRDNNRYTLAHVFMLAWPYGTAGVHSGYDFSQSNTGQGPPNGGTVRNCHQDGWQCQHTWRPIANMVQFRNAVRGEPVTDWWDNGQHAIAFGRGRKGFVVLNNEDGPITQVFKTSLAPGRYCDVQHGDVTESGTCSGPTVDVDANGQFSATVPAQEAIALYRMIGGSSSSPVSPSLSPPAGPTSSSPSRPTSALPPPVTGGEGASFSVRAETKWGENLFLVGNIPELGSWNPSLSLPLSPSSYPEWKVDVPLSAGKKFEYKYIKKEERDGKTTVTWEGGENRVAIVPSQGSKRARLTDTWRS